MSEMASTSAAGGVAPIVPPEAPRPPRPPQRRPKSKVLRFLGLNPYIMKDFIPSRKTAAYMSLALSPVAFYMYDRRCAEQIREEYKAKIRHLADAAMPDSGDLERDELEFPRKVWVMSSRVPDDNENDRANRWFKTYIQPILYTAGYDYSFLNGTAPGALGRRVRERIRIERIASMSPAPPRTNPGEAGYAEYLDKRRHALGMGLTVVIGRNTMKEYLWGMKQGWLDDFDAVEEQKGDEGRLQDLREKLAKDGRFDEEPVQMDLSSEEDRSAPRPAADLPQSHHQQFMPPRSSFSFFNQPSSPVASTSKAESTSTDDFQGKSLIVNGLSEIPTQPPMLFLPFDHPLGYLRYWPLKMFKYLFMERYRVQHGCETALSIVQAVHPTERQQASFTEDDETRRGLRSLQKPRNLEATEQNDHSNVAVEDVLNEKLKKLREEWRGNDLAETGSKDLDTGSYDEWHYRKSYNDTPANIVSFRNEFYNNLPEKLKTARELARRDRLPTKEEGKYPPPTEEELVTDRLNKEIKWKKDFEGWVMIRRGSKVSWDPRFESFKVLDLDMAKASRERYGFVGDEKSSSGEVNL